MVRDTIFNRPRLLVIANLEHSSPRVPSLLLPMAKMGWDITIITPRLLAEDYTKWNIHTEFSNFVKIVQTGEYRDVYQALREMVQLTGWVNKGAESGYTSAMKSHLGRNGITSSILTRTMVYFQSIFAYPDTEKAWERLAQDFVEREIKSGPPPVLISSSPYPITHVIANKFSKKYNLKWIADFRDPWSQNHNYKMPIWRKKLDERLEKKIIAGASLITTVSEGFAKKLRMIHDVPVTVVRNGFQSHQINTVSSSAVGSIRLLYTGRVYPDFQNYKLILAALSRIRLEHPEKIRKFKMDFYGPETPEIADLIKDLNLQEVVSQHRAVSRKKSRELQIQSDILVLFQWDEKNEQGIFPLKFYEYLDADRLILATGGDKDSEIEKVLDETGCGVCLENVSEIVEFLMCSLTQKEQFGKVKFNSNRKAVDMYSFEAIANIFSETIVSLSSFQANDRLK